MSRIFILIAAMSGFLSVAIGAFAAHKLKQQLSPELLQVVQTGVQYQMYHSLALLGVGILWQHKPAYTGLKASGLAFILGSLFFSGSLYALALGVPRGLGIVTPIGGLCFLLGWLLLIRAVWRVKA